MTDELERERKKNESGSVEWVQRCRKLTEELEWLRDLTEKLTGENKGYLKENKRYKRQLKTQEEDREFLIKQLVSVKKENARLRYSFEEAGVSGAAPALGMEQGRPRAAGSRPQSRPQSAASAASGRGRGRKDDKGGDWLNRLYPKKSAPMTAQTEQRYEQVLAKMQRQLDQEVTKYKMVQAAWDQQARYVCEHRHPRRCGVC